MTSAVSIWVQFVLCALVILFAGSRLVGHADVIASKTGLSGNWAGLVLLATVTSLPELFASVSAVTFNDLPNMAVSGVMGSCMFNMLVIALLDFASRKKPVSQMVHQGHVLSAGFGIVLMGFAAIDMLFGKLLPVLSVNKVDPISITYPIVYLIAMKLIFAYEKTRLQDFAGQLGQTVGIEQQSLTRSIALFAFYTVVITAAACYLPSLGDKIGKLTGWGPSFIGTSLIAVTTSLPEAAVSFAAARKGAFDMAVASLLGSNLFDIVILAIADFCYLKAPLLRCVSEMNLLAALTAMICMGIVVIGLTYRPEKKLWLMAGDAVAIVLVYILANVLIFLAH